MLYELEWQTPHPRPGGMSLRKWVAEVRYWEKAGFLVDPELRPLRKDAIPFVVKTREARYNTCFRLCWRERCRRAGRCKSFRPLALHEWKPELRVIVCEAANKRLDNCGEVDKEKLALLRELLNRPEKPPLPQADPKP